jgi:hypothetical protein
MSKYMTNPIDNRGIFTIEKVYFNLPTCLLCPVNPYKQNLGPLYSLILFYLLQFYPLITFQLFFPSPIG